MDSNDRILQSHNDSSAFCDLRASMQILRNVYHINCIEHFGFQQNQNYFMFIQMTRRIIKIVKEQS